MRRLMIVGTVGVVLAGCGGGDVRQELVDGLQSDAGLTADQATCVADGVYASFDAETINRLAAAETQGDIPAAELEIGRASCRERV